MKIMMHIPLTVCSVHQVVMRNHRRYSVKPTIWNNLPPLYTNLASQLFSLSPGRVVFWPLSRLTPHKLSGGVETALAPGFSWCELTFCNSNLDLTMCFGERNHCWDNYLWLGWPHVLFLGLKKCLWDSAFASVVINCFSMYVIIVRCVSI